MLKPIVICNGVFLNFDDVSLGEGENGESTRLLTEHILCVLLALSTCRAQPTTPAYDFIIPEREAVASIAPLQR